MHLQKRENKLVSVWIWGNIVISDLEKESLRDDIHKPADSWTKRRETEKMKEKLERTKQKREINSKLG